MLDHISLGVTDLERSRRFYDAALRPLGLVRTVDFEKRGSDYGAMAGQLGVEFTITLETGVSPLRGMHCSSALPTACRSVPFTARHSAREVTTMAALACARSIIPTTTRPLSSIRTGTVSRAAVVLSDESERSRALDVLAEVGIRTS
jgi:hypothetical protein